MFVIVPLCMVFGENNVDVVDPRTWNWYLRKRYPPGTLHLHYEMIINILGPRFGTKVGIKVDPFNIQHSKALWEIEQ